MKIICDYKTIVIDPPWYQRGAGKINRGAQKHYPIMHTPDIIKTITQSAVWNNISENAHLYLWTTNNQLPDALKVMEALGFKYITNVCWTKNQMGLGQYFRGKHELCLFGTRGRGVAVRTDSRKIPSTVEANKSIHSKKPDEFYKMVEQRSKGPYLDMFARNTRPGWSVWGDDITVDEDE